MLSTNRAPCCWAGRNGQAEGLRSALGGLGEGLFLFGQFCS